MELTRGGERREDTAPPEPRVRVKRWWDRPRFFLESVAIGALAAALAVGAVRLVFDARQPAELPVHPNLKRGPAPFEHDGAVRTVAFAPDGLFVVSGSADRTIRAWELASGVETHRHARPEAVERIALTPDGHVCLAALDHGALWVGDAADGHTRWLSPPRTPVTAIAISPDGLSALVGDSDGYLRQVDLATGSVLRWLEVTPEGVDRIGIPCIAFSPDGTRAFVGTTGDIVIALDMTTGERTRLSQPTRDGQLRALAVSPDGKALLLGGTWGLWRVNLETGERTLFPVRVGPVASVAFLPGGERAITGGEEGRITVLNQATCAIEAQFRYGAGIAEIAVSPDGRRLAVASESPTVEIWDIASGRQINSELGR
jgi:WD40 repeat protein